MTHRPLHAALLLLAVLAAGAVAPARALDLGLSPSHVVGLWTNINAAVMTLGERTAGAKLRAELEAMPLESASGKVSAEVLARVVEFRERLDRRRERLGLARAAVFVDPTGAKVTPSVVFLNSGHVLDALLGVLLEIDGQEAISPYYARHDIAGKTPSDAYAMVGLAIRRLDRIDQSR